MKLAMIIAPFVLFQSGDIFSRLVGTWQMQTKSGVLYESWQSSGDSKASGMSYMLKGKDSSVLERTTVTKEGTDIYYTALVSGQNNGQSVKFKLINKIGNYYIFENPKHDFPQRVIYEFATKDSIHARIEGNKNGKAESQDFYYTRKQ